MKQLKQLEMELVKEKETLEAKAFELFVKDKLSELMNEIARAKSTLVRWEEQKDSLDLDDYKDMFNQMNHNYSSTNKEYYIGKIKE